jgi:hypothetical protein
VTAILAAASLLLAGGAGMLATLLVAPAPGRRRTVALAAVSAVAVAVGLGLLLLDGAPAAAGVHPAHGVTLDGGAARR